MLELFFFFFFRRIDASRFSVGLGDGSVSVCRGQKKREEEKVDRRTAVPNL